MSLLSLCIHTPHDSVVCGLVLRGLTKTDTSASSLVGRGPSTRPSTREGPAQPTYTRTLDQENLTSDFPLRVAHWCHSRVKERDREGVGRLRVHGSSGGGGTGSTHKV